MSLFPHLGHSTFYYQIVLMVLVYYSCVFVMSIWDNIPMCCPDDDILEAMTDKVKL